MTEKRLLLSSYLDIGWKETNTYNQHWRNSAGCILYTYACIIWNIIIKEKEAINIRGSKGAQVKMEGDTKVEITQIMWNTIQL